MDIEKGKYIEHIFSSRVSLAIWLIDDFTREKPSGSIKVLIIGNKEQNIIPVRNLSGHYVFNDLPSGNFELTMESDIYLFEKRTIDTTRINNPDVSIEFSTNGRPGKGALWAILNDTSKLESGDIVELRNPKGDLEQRIITSIDNGSKTISWNEQLKNDFSAKYSNISILRYIPLEIILKPKPSYPFPDNATLVRGYASNTVSVKDALVEVPGEALTTITDKNGEFVLYFRNITARKISINIAKGTVSSSIPDVNLMIGGTISLGRISFP